MSSRVPLAFPLCPDFLCAYIVCISSSSVCSVYSVLLVLVCSFSSILFWKFSNKAAVSSALHLFVFRVLSCCLTQHNLTHRILIHTSCIYKDIWFSSADYSEEKEDVSMYRNKYNCISVTSLSHEPNYAAT